MYIKELTNEEFESFTLRFSVSSVYQTKEYALVMNKQGYSSIYIGLIDNDKIIGASLVLINKINGFKYAYAPRGFLIDYSNFEVLKEFTILLKKYLGKKDIIAIKICPTIIKSVYDYKLDLKDDNNNFNTYYNNLRKLGYYHLGFNNKFEALKPRYEAVIDLKKNQKDLFNSIKKEFKTKIRSAMNSGIDIYRTDKEKLEFLYNQTKEKYKRNLKYFEDTYDYFSRNDKIEFFCAKMNTEEYLKNITKEYETIENELNSFNEKLIYNKNYSKKTVEKKIILDEKYNNIKEKLDKAINFCKNYNDGIILATALVIKHMDTAYLIIDGYNYEFKNLNAKHLLIWKLIEKYSLEGYKKFNLGGISNINDNNRYNNLTKFKLNFNAKSIEYIGDFELITNNALYFMYKKVSPFKKILKKR